MRGLVLEGIEDIALRDDLPEPRLETPTDAVVRVRAAGLCGSDLHPYRGTEPARCGVVAGHELVGEVEAVGGSVERLAVGQRVLAAFTTSCGACAPCRRGNTARCRQGQLFGWGPPDTSDAALHGAQAERIRVPLADTTLVPIPDPVDDATALLLTDNLPTGWEAVARAGEVRDRPMVIVGLGSVGLCAVVAAVAAGAAPILAVDPVADRRARARRLGATRAVAPDAARESLAELLVGEADADERLAAAAVDAAGSVSGQRLAFELLRPGGTLSIIAVQTTDRFTFTPVEAYDRNVEVRVGRASVGPGIATLLERITAGDLRPPTEVCVTHPEVPLDEGPELYRRFAAREAGLVKAMFRP